MLRGSASGAAEPLAPGSSINAPAAPDVGPLRTIPPFRRPRGRRFPALLASTHAVCLVLFAFVGKRPGKGLDPHSRQAVDLSTSQLYNNFSEPAADFGDGAHWEVSDDYRRADKPQAQPAV